MGLPSSPRVVIVAGFCPLYLSPMLRSGTSAACTDLGAALSLIAAECLSASRPARGAEAAAAIPAAASDNGAEKGAAATDEGSDSGEVAEVAEEAAKPKRIEAPSTINLLMQVHMQTGPN